MSAYLLYPELQEVQHHFPSATYYWIICILGMFRISLVTFDIEELRHLWPSLKEARCSASWSEISFSKRWSSAEVKQVLAQLSSSSALLFWLHKKYHCVPQAFLPSPISKRAPVTIRLWNAASFHADRRHFRHNTCVLSCCDCLF